MLPLTVSLSVLLKEVDLKFVLLIELGISTLNLSGRIPNSLSPGFRFSISQALKNRLTNATAVPKKRFLVFMISCF
jgi:hypothetical protein